MLGEVVNEVVKRSSDVAFCIRRVNCGEVEAGFGTGRLEEKSAMRTVGVKEWMLCPSFPGRRSVEVGVGGVSPGGGSPSV